MRSMTSDSAKDAVKAYYAQFNEWDRLDRPEGVLEFAIVTETFNRHLTSPARILDIGGGPGRYAISLAEHGHTVTLADLSPNLLKVARAKIAEADLGGRVEEIVEADACDLGQFEDSSFD